MKNYNQPNTLGRFGEYGGMYVSETLMPLLIDLDQSYQKIQKDKKFQKELEDLFKNYVGRPSALHHAKNLSAYLNGPKVYFKRDELNHTGAHKINNCLGQILLAKKMINLEGIIKHGTGHNFQILKNSLLSCREG
jgi:tryptophan synthase beta chain